MSTLAVLVDGHPLSDDEAHAFWERYSAWMQENRANLEGFASLEGLESVHPEMHGGRAVLVASRKAPQRPYAPAPKKR